MRIALIGKDKFLKLILPEIPLGSYWINDNTEETERKLINVEGKNGKWQISTNRLVKMASKTPIVVEESRNIIFFPLKSTREKNNIWISFNNLDTYTKDNNKTIFTFKCGKLISLNFSYYIIDNQVTRSLILDYELNNRRKSLEK